MDRFNALGRGLQLMLVGSVLLLIDTFFNWQSIDTPIGTFGQSAWHGFGGVLLGLLTIVLVAWLLVRLAAVDIQLPVSATLIAAFLAFLILIIAVLKNLVDDYSSFWSYVGIGLAVVIAVGAWMQIQATGGVESLKTEASSMVPAGAGQSAETPAAAPEPAAPPSPPPPAPEASAAEAPPQAAPEAPPAETPAAPSEPTPSEPAASEPPASSGDESSEEQS
jgi:hypothetical protein